MSALACLARCLGCSALIAKSGSCEPILKCILFRNFVIPFIQLANKNLNSPVDSWFRVWGGAAWGLRRVRFVGGLRIIPGFGPGGDFTALLMLGSGSSTPVIRNCIYCINIYIVFNSYIFHTRKSI